MWLLPTRRRINHLTKFFTAYKQTQGSTPGVLLVQRDEYAELRDDYDTLTLPDGWSISTTNADPMGMKVREWMVHAPYGCEWLGLLCDDLIPNTPKWDLELISKLNGWNVVSCNDGWQAPRRMNGAVVWSGDLLRAVGYMFPEGLLHLFIDNVWEELGRITGCWYCEMPVVVRHNHASLTGEKDDTYEKVGSFWEHDEKRFIKWCTEGERDIAVKAIQDLQKSRNVIFMTPDFRGVRLMIATPSISCDYDTTYVGSLITTMRALGDLGVIVEWAEEKHNADICLARAKIFSTFLKSQCTHLLMIDADMGWEPSSVFRLFAANKELVAVAGPKKKYPLEFAANKLGFDGKPIPLEMDPVSCTAKVDQVGMAFALMKRSCAEKMVMAYNYLEYDALIGEGVEYGLYMPMIKNRRYMSEDYAFCERWRDIGGEVHICPDIPLSHTGKHTFRGSLVDSWLHDIESAKMAAE